MLLVVKKYVDDIQKLIYSIYNIQRGTYIL